jgi:light-regulated signal transduction histidine kinase (bacteriophytochrome)
MEDFSESELPKQLQAAVSHWRHESTPALNILNGYTDLLRRGISGPLTDEQQELLDHIAVAAARLGRCWVCLSLCACAIGPPEQFPLEAVSLAEEIEQVSVRLRHSPAKLHVQAQLPPDLPMIAGNSLLPAAISFLIYPEDEHSKVHAFSPKVRVEPDATHSLRVHITTRPLNRISDQTELDLGQLYPGTCLWTATLILQRCDCRIRVHATPEDTTFTFQLRVWEQKY